MISSRYAQDSRNITSSSLGYTNFPIFSELHPWTSLRGLQRSHTSSSNLPCLVEVLTGEISATSVTLIHLQQWSSLLNDSFSQTRN